MRCAVLLWFFLASCVRADTYVLSFDGVGRQDKEAINVLNAMKKRLKQPLHCRYIAPGRGTPELLDKNLKWLKRNVKKDDLVIIYIGAHGGVTKQGRLEFTCKNARGKCVPCRVLVETTESLPGTSLVLLDTCHSGAALREAWNKTTVVCASRADEAAFSGGMDRALIAVFRKAYLKRTVANIADDMKDMIPRCSPKQHPVVRYGPAPDRNVIVVPGGWERRPTYPGH